MSVSVLYSHTFHALLGLREGSVKEIDSALLVKLHAAPIEWTIQDGALWDKPNNANVVSEPALSSRDPWRRVWVRSVIYGAVQ